MPDWHLHLRVVEELAVRCAAATGLKVGDDGADLRHDRAIGGVGLDRADQDIAQRPARRGKQVQPSQRGWRVPCRDQADQPAFGMAGNPDCGRKRGGKTDPAAQIIGI